MKRSSSNKRIKAAGIIIILFLGSFLTALTVVKADDLKLQVPLNNEETQEINTDSGDTRGIGEYLISIYNYGIGIIGILATVMLMAAGIIWLTAGGNTGRVETAKSMIAGALTGLLLALFAYTLLYQINPDLLEWEYVGIKEAGEEASEQECKPGSDNTNSCDNCESGYHYDEDEEKYFCGQGSSDTSGASEDDCEGSIVNTISDCNDLCEGDLNTKEVNGGVCCMCK